MKTLVSYSGPEAEYPNAFLYLSVLSGQLLKIDSDKLSITLWSQWVGEISKYYDEVKHMSGKDIETITRLCLDDIEGYVLTTEKTFYKDLNELVRDKRFLLLVIEPYLEDICKKLNIEKVTPKPELEFDKHSFLNIKYSRRSSSIDLAVKDRLYTNFTNFFRKPKHIVKPFTVFGWAGTKKLFGIDIPLEGPYVSTMTRSGGKILPADLNHNLALYYSLNSKFEDFKLPKETPEYISPITKHLISFVISDGDNMGMIDSKIKAELSQQRDFPVNWTLNPSMPKMFIKYMYDRIGSFNDGLIVAPSGSGYLFVSDVVETENYWNPLQSQMKELGLSVINQISISATGLLSLLGSLVLNKNVFNKIPKTLTNNETKAVLSYDYFDYSKGNGKSKVDETTNTRIITPGPLRLYFQKDLERFKKFKWPETTPTNMVVAVNFNSFKIKNLKEIVKTLPDDVQIVNIHTILNKINLDESKRGAISHLTESLARSRRK